METKGTEIAPNTTMVTPTTASPTTTPNNTVATPTTTPHTTVATPTTTPHTTVAPTTATPTTTPHTTVTPTTATPTSKPNTTSVPTAVPVLTGLGHILPKHMFLDAFPNAHPLYTYENLLAMATKYPEFASTGDVTADRREVATFLGHVALESGDLRFVEELKVSTMCQESPEYPCAPGKQYHGRGAIQLSWNYNYKDFGKVANIELVQFPELVATDPDLLWWSALWYSNDDRWNGNIHKVVGRPGGFAYVTFMINGGLECGLNPSNKKSEATRIANYVKFCSMLGVDPGDNLSCQTAAYPPKNLWIDPPTKRL
ncbi:hypothetical protein, variant [Aphanomyces astaci]|nr:hypothetical protein, variant [Aphanomyces astaci]ETV85632.1 hypothetical protein, variant [Aphanomyces astaci]|eukprot:XP_009824104.1 hypothetical protein, variant [Aphanomyces astaci]